MNKNKNNYSWTLTSIRRSSSFCLSFLFLLWRIFLWEFSFSIFLPPSCSLQISTEKLLSESQTQIIFRIDADLLMWVSVTWDIWWLTRLEGVTGIQFISIAGASLPQRRTEKKFKQSNHGQCWTLEDLILPLRAVLVTDQTVSVKSFII